jgi:hypothetical protein
MSKAKKRRRGRKLMCSVCGLFGYGVVMTSFNVKSWKFSGQTEENHTVVRLYG